MGLLNFEELQKCQLELSHQFMIQQKERKKKKYAEFLKRRTEAESQNLKKKNIHGKYNLYELLNNDLNYIRLNHY